MTSSYHHYSGLLFDGKNSVQLNYQGLDQKGIEEFAKDCQSRGARFAQLMNLRTGKVAASFSESMGLEIPADHLIPGAPLADVLDDFFSDEYRAKIAAALCAGIREIDFSPAQYAHLTKYLTELGPGFLPEQPTSPAGPGGMG